MIISTYSHHQQRIRCIYIKKKEKGMWSGKWENEKHLEVRKGRGEQRSAEEGAAAWSRKKELSTYWKMCKNSKLCVWHFASFFSLYSFHFSFHHFLLDLLCMWLHSTLIIFIYHFQFQKKKSKIKSELTFQHALPMLPNVLNFAFNWFYSTLYVIYTFFFIFTPFLSYFKHCVVFRLVSVLNMVKCYFLLYLCHGLEFYQKW